MDALARLLRRFLVAVGLFGAEDFAHPLLILLATQKLTPILGAPKGANIAVGLYALHNIFYVAFALLLLSPVESINPTANAGAASLTKWANSFQIAGIT